CDVVCRRGHSGQHFWLLFVRFISVVFHECAQVPTLAECFSGRHSGIVLPAVPIVIVVVTVQRTQRESGPGCITAQAKFLPKLSANANAEIVQAGIAKIRCRFRCSNEQVEKHKSCSGVQRPKLHRVDCWYCLYALPAYNGYRATLFNPSGNAPRQNRRRVARGERLSRDRHAAIRDDGLSGDESRCSGSEEDG